MTRHDCWVWVMVPGPCALFLRGRTMVERDGLDLLYRLRARHCAEGTALFSPIVYMP